jgi:hypothetical protein
MYIRGDIIMIKEKCEHDTCLWSVTTIFNVCAVSDNRLLTECDVECLKCGTKKYVVSSGNILEDGDDIQ